MQRLTTCSNVAWIVKPTRTRWELEIKMLHQLKTDEQVITNENELSPRWQIVSLSHIFRTYTTEICVRGKHGTNTIHTRLKAVKYNDHLKCFSAHSEWWKHFLVYLKRLGSIILKVTQQVARLTNTDTKWQSLQSFPKQSLYTAPKQLNKREVKHFGFSKEMKF